MTQLLDHHPVAVQGQDPEGVHKMRTAARRLRSDLKTFRPLLDREVTDPLRDELKRLGEVLGAVRDPDVLCERLRASAARVLEADDAAALDEVLARLESDRDAAVGRLHRALGSDRYRRLLDDLVAVADAPPLRGDAGEPALDVLPALVHKPWRSLRRMVDDLDDHPSDGDLHEVRKQAKQVRYAAEAVRSAVGPSAKRGGQGGEEGAGPPRRAPGHRRGRGLAAGTRRRRPTTTVAAAFVLGALVADERAQRRARRDDWPATWAEAADPDRWDWVP